MKFFIKKIYAILRRILLILRNLPFLGVVSNAPCYFDSRNRKNAFERYIDNVAWLVKKGEKNRFYTQYGLDIKGRKSEDYIGFGEFAGLRNSYNQLLRFDNSIGILRDKFLNRLTGGLVSKRIVNSYSKKELLAIQNYLECEAHRELWLEGLKNV